MINLRYHIVSITAVFLALGIGLTLGSTFLDRVTVDNLNSQLSEVSAEVSETRTEIEGLREQINRSTERDAELASELPEQLLTGRLTAVPTLVIATRGTEAKLVDQARDVLAAAGSEVAGTWWLTDRWELDDAEEVDDLSQVLDLTSVDPSRLRRNSAIRLSGLIAAASQPAPAPDGGLPIPARSEPELVARLVQSGFIDYEAMPGASDPRVLLPGTDVRVVVVSGVAPTTGVQSLAVGLIEEAAGADRPAYVAAQGLTPLPDTPEPASEDDRRTTFVGAVRSGEVTKGRITTVDDLDLAAGRAALVLALEDLATGQIGHYGVAAGANRLLPPPVPAP